MALVRSSRRSSIWTRNDCRAGTSSALMNPSRSDSAMTCQIASRPEYIRPASIRAWTIDSTCVRMTRRCRSTRSTSTPAKGASTNVGIRAANPTRPSSKALWLNRQTSQATAVICIQVPISEMPWPMKKSRKFRCFSDRNNRRKFIDHSDVRSSCDMRVNVWGVRPCMKTGIALGRNGFIVVGEDRARTFLRRDDNVVRHGSGTPTASASNRWLSGSCPTFP